MKLDRYGDRFGMYKGLNDRDIMLSTEENVVTSSMSSSLATSLFGVKSALLLTID